MSNICIYNCSIIFTHTQILGRVWTQNLSLGSNSFSTYFPFNIKIVHTILIREAFQTKWKSEMTPPAQKKTLGTYWNLKKGSETDKFEVPQKMLSKYLTKVLYMIRFYLYNVKILILPPIQKITDPNNTKVFKISLKTIILDIYFDHWKNNSMFYISWHQNMLLQIKILYRVAKRDEHSWIKYCHTGVRKLNLDWISVHVRNQLFQCWIVNFGLVQIWLFQCKTVYSRIVRVLFSQRKIMISENVHICFCSIGIPTFPDLDSLYESEYVDRQHLLKKIL